MVSLKVYMGLDPAWVVLRKGGGGVRKGFRGSRAGETGRWWW
jgi:hypothetical protein